jgi:hypothetical protein
LKEATGRLQLPLQPTTSNSAALSSFAQCRDLNCGARAYCRRALLEPYIFINFSKVSKMEQRRESAELMVNPSPTHQQRLPVTESPLTLPPDLK